MNLKKTLSNKVFHYIISRYATYVLQFINSLFIAVYLGPYYLGVWGFITLVVQYLNQINLGIPHSVNAILSVNKRKEWYVQKVTGTSLTMLIGLSFLVILFFVFVDIFKINLGNKYNFSVYAPAVVLTGILAYYNSLLSNIFRVYGKVTEVAVNQSAFPVLMLLSVLLFKRENLLWALVWANVLAFLLSFLLFLFRTPVKLKLFLIWRLVKTIQIKGWHLFVYNTSFYLIVISTRSFISAYYPVEEFGYFTFAYSMANVILLLLQSFSFLIFPKLINRMASISNQRITELLKSIRDAYITTSHFLIHLAICIFPFFLNFFPQYQSSSGAFNIIALTVVLYTNSFGYSGLLIAKNHERKLGYLSFFALVINIILTYIIVVVLTKPFQYVMVATMISYFIYIYLVGVLGRKILQNDTGIKSVFNDIYPLRLLVPYIVCLFFIITNANPAYYFVSLTLFIVFNYKVIQQVKIIMKNIITNPNFVDI